MTIIKSYTDLQQSKKLAEILSLESADMRYDEYISYIDGTPKVGYKKGVTDGIPCWSLAALLGVVPGDWWGYNKHYFLEISKMGDSGKPYEVRYFRFREDWEGANFGRITHISYTSDSLVDACVEMIIKLHELKML